MKNDVIPLVEEELAKIRHHLLFDRKAWEILKIGETHAIQLYFAKDGSSHCLFCNEPLSGQHYLSTMVRYKSGTFTSEHAIYTCADIDACRFRRAVEDPCRRS